MGTICALSRTLRLTLKGKVKCVGIFVFLTEKDYREECCHINGTTELSFMMYISDANFSEDIVDSVCYYNFKWN